LAKSDALNGATPTPGSNETIGSTALRDPWENWNRKVFAFNNAVDRAFAEPFARAYQKYTPTPLRDGVRNWVNNLRSPVIFANDLLQGSPSRAGVTVARFGVNTTIGIVGLFDPAKKMGLGGHSEDFGQTLGRYGAKPGPYVMLPLLGPSTLRDSFGGLVDMGLDPLTYAKYDGDDAVRVARTIGGVATARTDALDAVSNLRATSPDAYVTLRSLYSQARESEIRNGQQNVEDLPDFGDPMDEPGGTTATTESSAGVTEAPKP
jgi:phospholipid-binding lipoprotein MlaA